MSAGNFITSFYASNRTGLVHPIRIQPETLALEIGGVANATPGGPATNPISAQVSQSKRSLGLNARTVTIKFPTAAPTGYAVGSTITLPWLNSANFDAISKSDAVTYLGATGEVVGTKPETAN
jgi:hypothetical protein